MSPHLQQVNTFNHRHFHRCSHTFDRWYGLMVKHSNHTILIGVHCCSIFHRRLCRWNTLRSLHSPFHSCRCRTTHTFCRLRSHFHSCTFKLPTPSAGSSVTSTVGPEVPGSSIASPGGGAGRCTAAILKPKGATLAPLGPKILHLLDSIPLDSTSFFLEVRRSWSWRLCQ